MGIYVDVTIQPDYVSLSCQDTSNLEILCQLGGRH